MNSNAKVGIFFKVSNDFLIDALPVDKGEPYGDAIQYSGHYDFHETLQPKTPAEFRFKSHDYDFYPRGRVVYFKTSGTFTMYVDPCLTGEETNQLITLFNLDGQKVNIAADEHYRCAKCNKFYLE